MTHRPQDSDLTFYLQVYRDAREARWCLTNLRQLYPHARVIMISDGDDDPVWPRLAKRFGVQYLAGQRMYGTEFGGRMIQRMLDVYAEQPTEYLIKIDTDTWAHRRLQFLPTGCRVFGTLEWSTWGNNQPLGFPNVQGGFVGYTRQAAQLIRSSKVLLSNQLMDYAGTYADVEEIQRRAEQGMVSSDFLTRYACRVLGIACEEFDEVKSKYRGWVAETDGQFAFTHPHKSVARRSMIEHHVRHALPTPVKVQMRSALGTAVRATMQAKAWLTAGRPTTSDPFEREPTYHHFPEHAESDAA